MWGRIKGKTREVKKTIWKRKEKKWLKEVFRTSQKIVHKKILHKEKFLKKYLQAEKNIMNEKFYQILFSSYPHILETE